jgi:hypothetical protein
MHYIVTRLKNNLIVFTRLLGKRTRIYQTKMQEQKDFNVENISHEKAKKPWSPSNKTSLC